MAVLDSVYDVTMTHKNNVLLQTPVKFKGICFAMNEEYLEFIDLDNNVRKIPKGSGVANPKAITPPDANASGLVANTMYDIKLTQDFEGETITYPPCCTAEYIETLGKYHFFLDPYTNRFKGFIQTQIETKKRDASVPALVNPEVKTEKPAVVNPVKPEVKTEKPAVVNPEKSVKPVLTSSKTPRLKPGTVPKSAPQASNIPLFLQRLENDVSFTDDSIPAIFEEVKKRCPTSGEPIKMYPLPPVLDNVCIFIKDTSELNPRLKEKYNGYYLVKIEGTTATLTKLTEVVAGNYFLVQLKNSRPEYVLNVA